METTKTGKPCQSWTSQLPHAHYNTNPIDFPDHNLVDAQNYCRNPYGLLSAPWCYTTDPNSRWEFCDVPPCDSLGKSIGFAISKIKVPETTQCVSDIIVKWYLIILTMPWSTEITWYIAKTSCRSSMLNRFIS